MNPFRQILVATVSSGVTECSTEEALTLSCNAGTICKVVGDRPRCAEDVAEGWPDEIDEEEEKDEKDEKKCTRECPAEFECQLNGDKEECVSENGKLCEKNAECPKDKACWRIPGTSGQPKVCLNPCKFVGPRVRCLVQNHEVIAKT